VAVGLARQRALAANTQTEERAKTDELEQTLEILRQREEELNQRLLEASTAVATALEKTPAAADQVLPCLGDAHSICQRGHSFVWTVKQQEDHVRFFGAAGPRPARCSACRQRWKKRKKWK
jgi:chromosome segregation ATPase